MVARRLTNSEYADAQNSGRADHFVPTDDLLLLPREAAALLRVSEQTLFRMTKAGDVAFVRVGRRGVRYRKSTLETWAEQREERNGIQEIREVVAT